MASLHLHAHLVAPAPQDRADHVLWLGVAPLPVPVLVAVAELVALRLGHVPSLLPLPQQGVPLRPAQEAPGSSRPVELLLARDLAVEIHAAPAEQIAVAPLVRDTSTFMLKPLLPGKPMELLAPRRRRGRRRRCGSVGRGALGDDLVDDGDQSRRQTTDRRQAMLPQTAAVVLVLRLAVVAL